MLPFLEEESFEAKVTRRGACSLESSLALHVERQMAFMSTMYNLVNSGCACAILTLLCDGSQTMGVVSQRRYR
jgi:hypothetical protein